MHRGPLLKADVAAHVGCEIAEAGGQTKWINFRASDDPPEPQQGRSGFEWLNTALNSR